MFTAGQLHSVVEPLVSKNTFFVGRRLFSLIKQAAFAHRAVAERQCYARLQQSSSSAQHRSQQRKSHSSRLGGQDKKKCCLVLLNCVHSSWILLQFFAFRCAVVDDGVHWSKCGWLSADHHSVVTGVLRGADFSVWQAGREDRAGAPEVPPMLHRGYCRGCCLI